jgi:hypothetical protein
MMHVFRRFLDLCTTAIAKPQSDDGSGGLDEAQRRQEAARSTHKCCDIFLGCIGIDDFELALGRFGCLRL